MCRIMGLRAVTSQLLPEHAVDRDVRRTSYDLTSATGLSEPENMNAFDGHVAFPPHEGRGNGTASGRDSRRAFLAWLSRPQRVAGIVDADPMVREPQLVLRPDRRHVARRARPTHVLTANRGWASAGVVAVQAAYVVTSGLGGEWRVRVVAPHARQRLAAGLDTGAPREVYGLVTDIPRIAPVDYLYRRSRRSVAGAAAL